MRREGRERKSLAHLIAMNKSFSIYYDLCKHVLCCEKVLGTCERALISTYPVWDYMQRQTQMTQPKSTEEL